MTFGTGQWLQQKTKIPLQHRQNKHSVHDNKRPMGRIAHLRNQFKSMNTFKQSYDYLYIHVYHKIGPVVQEENIF